MLEEYTHRYSITAADMDTGYRMTPSAVLLYYQDCWARYMGCLHLAAFDIVKKNLMWVISEFNAWTTEETAYWGDDIEVNVWNSEISALRVYAEFRITKTNGKEVAHGYGIWTLLDTIARRLAPNTPLAPMMTVHPEFTVDGHKKHRFPMGGKLDMQIEHKVNPINLDFNGHVNNRTYLMIAMQTANEQFINAYAIRHFAIHWLHETFLNDTLTCNVYVFEPGVFLHSITNQDGATVAEIYSEWVPRSAEPDVADIACRE